MDPDLGRRPWSTDEKGKPLVLNPKKKNEHISKHVVYEDQFPRAAFWLAGTINDCISRACLLKGFLGRQVASGCPVG